LPEAARLEVARRTAMCRATVFKNLWGEFRSMRYTAG